MVTKDMIKNSLEAKWRRNQAIFWIIVYTILFLVMILISIVICINDNNFSFFLIVIAILFGVYLIPFLSVLTYYFYKYKKLLKNIEEYQVYEVLLDRPETSWACKGAVYYTVTFRIDSDNVITLDTKPIWSSSIFSVASLEEYNNKRIQIAYDAKHNEVIVLGDNY